MVLKGWRFAASAANWALVLFKLGSELGRIEGRPAHPASIPVVIKARVTLVYFMAKSFRSSDRPPTIRAVRPK